MFGRVASDMSEAPDKPEDQPSGQPQPDEEERPPLGEVPEDELKEILKAHGKWLRSDGKDGEQADLSNADLGKTDLLIDADLRKANLQGANLTQGQLDKACGDTKTKLPPNLSVKLCPKESK